MSHYTLERFQWIYVTSYSDSVFDDVAHHSGGSDLHKFVHDLRVEMSSEDISSEDEVHPRIRFIRDSKTTVLLRS